MLILPDTCLGPVIISIRKKKKRPDLIASLLARFLFPFHKAFAEKPLYSAPVRAAERPVWEIFTAAFPRGLKTPENAACKECRQMGMPPYVPHNEHT
jgi:hypothetical protein